MKYKAVIFDFDDTLVESRLQKWAQHKHVAKKFYNIDLSDDDIRKHWGKPLNILISDLYQSSDTLEKMIEAIHSTRHDFMKKVYEGAPGLLKDLISKGIKIGVVSATNKYYLIEDLSLGGFPHEDFFIMQGSDEVVFHKPDPKVFQNALKNLENYGIKGKEILYVGDSIDDLKAAHGAGIDFIALTTGLYSKEDFEKAGAKVVLSDIRQLLKLI